MDFAGGQLVTMLSFTSSGIPWVSLPVASASPCLPKVLPALFELVKISRSSACLRGLGLDRQTHPSTENQSCMALPLLDQGS